MENKTGKVMQDKMWEIITSPLAIGFASPYALGITTMFIPSGMEMETTAQMYAICGIGIKDKTAENVAGIATRRINDNM